MNDPLFHPSTTPLLTHIKQDLPQSLLLSGPRGVGLATAAAWLAGSDIAHLVAPRDAKGNVHTSGTISVEMIRQLYEQTRTRTTKRHIVIIDDAERMSPAASGSFLKLLEEPGTSVHFILTSHHPHQLIATIRSRVQHAELRPLTQDQTTALLHHHDITDPTKRLQLEFIAAGLPAEIARLIENEAYFSEQAKIISDARDFLKGTPYQKLLVTHTYRQDRTLALLLCDAILTLLRRSLVLNPQPALVTQIDRLLAARERIAHNGNTALQLARFVI
jgi:hypothetical protein